MLSDASGVQSVEIDFNASEATCVVGKDVDPQTLAKAVTGRFSASVKP